MPSHWHLLAGAARMRRLCAVVLSLILALPASAQVAFASVSGAVTVVSGATAMPLPVFLEGLGRQSGRSVLVLPGVPTTPVNYQFSRVSWSVVWSAVLAAHKLASCITPELITVGPVADVSCAAGDLVPAPAPLAPPSAAVPVAPVERYAVRVRVLEVADNSGTAGGVDWSQGLLSGLFGTAVSALTGGAITPPASLSTAIAALEQKGLARKLDDVRLNLTAGELTTFTSGGTLQLSLVSGGAANIERNITYGLTLALRPTPSPDGAVALDVQADLSSPVSVSNPSLLDLTRRSVHSSVATRRGAAVVLAAFASLRDEHAASGLPGAVSVPVVGWLAGRASSSSARTSVVVILDVEP